jgi:hypothetical protein
MAEEKRPVQPVDGSPKKRLFWSIISDYKGAPDVRPTVDVDVIVEIGCYVEYITFFERLRQLGFAGDNSQGAPFCRWIIEGKILDVMPTDEAILGFSNPWYRDAISYACDYDLTEHLRIRVVTPPHFLATKLEAFRAVERMTTR